MAVARAFADDLLNSQDAEEDQAPTVLPINAGRHGTKPLLVKLPYLNEEADFLINRLIEANKIGIPWNDMAIVYRRYGIGQKVVDKLPRKGIPHEWQQGKKHSCSPGLNSAKLITMHSSKGLEFSMVCIPGLGARSQEDEHLQDEARLLYVAMTRATNELIMTYDAPSTITEKLEKAMSTLGTL